MNYNPRYFDPKRTGGKALGEAGAVTFSWREDERTECYVFAPKVILAVNVALATGRPLLVAGEPGSGKSTLANAIAKVQGWWYYQQTVTSRTQAADLLWRFDSLRRLNDANTRGTKLLSNQYYVEPGAVWWGFDPLSAAQRGLREKLGSSAEARDPGVRGVENKAVVLIDEIDKADPDVPNDLLEPFDVQQFTVKETNDVIVAKRKVFLLLTTNGERELPLAFVRRCVSLRLDEPDATWFMWVAAEHDPAGDQQLHERIAGEVMRLRGEAEARLIRRPSTAEFLDALAACRDLELDESFSSWEDVARGVLWKSPQAFPPRPA